MAIYKPSNFSPFLSAEDLTKPLNITCELNTSNVTVTGYKLKVLDNNNNVIFEGESFDELPGGNTGLNGSILVIPFIFVDETEPKPEDLVTIRNSIHYYGGDYYTYSENKFDKSRFFNGYEMQPYKYIVTLAQGQQEDSFVQVPGNPKYFDMEVTSGTVIGSTPNRIQSYLSENIYKDYFIQLMQADDSGKGISRQLITSYDHTYGYIYPQENKFTQEDLDKASYFQIYKNSNDPTVIASANQVLFAGQKKMGWQGRDNYNVPGFMTLTGDSFGTHAMSSQGFSEDAIWVIDGKKQVWYKYQQEKTSEWHILLKDAPDGSTVFATIPIRFQVNVEETTQTNVEKTIRYVGGDTINEKICSVLEHRVTNPSAYSVEAYNVDKSSGAINSTFTHSYTYESDAKYISFNFDFSKAKDDSLEKYDGGSVEFVSPKDEDLFICPCETKWAPDEYPYNFDQTFTMPYQKFDVKISDFDGGFDGVLKDDVSILVKNETRDDDSSPYNGVFTLQSQNIKDGKLTLRWLRAANYDTWAEVGNNIVYVQNGTDKGNIYQADFNSSVVGEINETSFKYVKEKPIEIYSDATLGYGGNSETNGRVFKNSTTETFIRPFNGIQDNNKFTYTTDNWISSKSETIDKIDTTKWSIITKNALSAPLAPDKDKYKVTSFFKTSDENPFYAYEKPTVKISEDVFQKDASGNLTINTTTAYFSGSFTQVNNKSWASFYWVLEDLELGTYVQSEKSFDGAIEYEYNGFQSDRTYRLSLYIQDEFDEVYSDSLDFKVQIEFSSDKPEFLITFDCATNSYLFNLDKIDFNVRKAGTSNTYEPFLINNESFYLADSSSNNGSIFRQEVRVETIDGVETVEELTPFELVDTNNITRDFNISNGRTYRYRYYLDVVGDELPQFVDYIPPTANWQNWSITELHPVDNDYKKFTATENDVWLFNLNVSTGEQTQNIIRNEQQTLGQYKKYAQGKSNYISGSVNCLLGPDVLPASYIIKNGKVENVGGYREYRDTIPNPTSNERIDMLKAWRELVYSSNPKLLKDRAGQSFLITINSAGNTPMDNVRKQPNTINFTWTQIGDVEDITVVEQDIRVLQPYTFIYNYDKTIIIGIKSDDPLKVESVTIPSSVTEIKPSFILFQNLVDINYVGENATVSTWGNIKGLKNLMAPYRNVKRRLYINEELVTEVNGEMGTQLRGYAFANCNDIVSVSMPSAESTIYYAAFKGCNSIKTMELYYPYTNEYSIIGSIFGATFCTYNKDYVPASLKTVNIVGNNSIPVDCFYGCKYIEEVNMDTYIDTIGASAFEGCKALKNIILPSSLFSIADATFKNSGLESITIGNRVESIGNYAFADCNLKTVSLSDGVKTIGKWCFAGNGALSEIEIPSNVDTIGASAFEGDRQLENITLHTPTTTLTIGSNAFKLNKPAETTLNIHVDNYAEYANRTILKDFYSSPFSGNWHTGALSNLYSEGSLTTYLYFEDYENISPYAFACANIKNLELVNPIGGVGSVGFSAFKQCPIDKITLAFTGKSRSEPSHFGYIFGAENYLNQNDLLPRNGIEVEFVSPPITEDGGGEVIVADNGFYGCKRLNRITINETYNAEKRFICGENAFAGITAYISRPIQLSFGTGELVSTGTYGDPNSVFDHIRYLCQCGEFENEYSSPVCCSTLGCIVDGNFAEFTTLDIKPKTNVGDITINPFAFANLRIGYAIEIGPQQSTCRIKRGAFYRSSLINNWDESYVSIGPTCILDDYDSEYGINIQGYGSFQECEFKTVTVAGKFFDGNESSDAGTFENSKMVEVSAPQSLKSTLTAIPRRCFYDCEALQKVTGPITLLGFEENTDSGARGAFQECKELTTVRLATTNIPMNTFNGCDRLTDINETGAIKAEIWIPQDGYVGRNAFFGCKNIFNLRIRGIPSSSGSESYRLYPNAFNFGYSSPDFYVSAPSPQTLIASKDGTIDVFTQSLPYEALRQTAIIHVQRDALSSYSGTNWKNNAASIVGDYTPEV